MQAITQFLDIQNHNEILHFFIQMLKFDFITKLSWISIVPT